MLATIGGAVSRPGVCELSIGTPVARLLEATGGVTDEVQAVLFGGYFGSWLDADTAMRLELSNASLGPAGAALGCGVVVALGRRTCGLVESANVLRYLSHETAGQCGPCVNGVGAAAKTLHDVARHGANQRQLDDLQRWIDIVPGRGGCRMPDGAMRFLQSSLEVFHDELVLHAKGRCSATDRASVLPVRASEQGWR
jgi:NADH:ubiquinone oxidoreductase subunit F (NADH-binding)